MTCGNVSFLFLRRNRFHLVIEELHIEECDVRCVAVAVVEDDFDVVWHGEIGFTIAFGVRHSNFPRRNEKVLGVLTDRVVAHARQC